MILVLSWSWGIGFLILAIVSTVLVMELSENIGFGVGWGLPWAGSAVFSVFTLLFVKGSLKRERTEWRSKEVNSTRASVI
jgi:hypothetical protein